MVWLTEIITAKTYSLKVIYVILHMKGLISVLIVTNERYIYRTVLPHAFCAPFAFYEISYCILKFSKYKLEHCSVNCTWFKGSDHVECPLFD